MWRGRYSWLITIVTPKVPITAIPISMSAIAPGIPPTSTKTSTRAGRREAPEKRRSNDQQRGGGETRRGNENAAPETDPEHDRRRRDRPEPVADVAADREQGHPARPAPSAHVRRELRAFRMVCRRP